MKGSDLKASLKTTKYFSINFIVLILYSAC